MLLLKIVNMFGFGMGFGLFEIMFSLVFVLFIVVFVGTLIKGLSQWNKNNNSPRLTVVATVVSKRTNVSGQEYGLLVEGDVGMLSFQGTRYLGFERA